MTQLRPACNCRETLHGLPPIESMAPRGLEDVGTTTDEESYRILCNRVAVWLADVTDCLEHETGCFASQVVNMSGESEDIVQELVDPAWFARFTSRSGFMSWDLEGHGGPRSDVFGVESGWDDQSYAAECSVLFELACVTQLEIDTDPADRIRE